jgi:hypothetical protein
MIKRIQNTLFICFVLLTNSSFSQSISGNLKLLNNQEIKLEGFIGIKNYPISSTKIDENGNFTLSYSKADYGVGYLMSGDEKPLFVILSGEDIEIVGEALGYIETIKIIKGSENYERGWYTGVFGVFDGTSLDSGVMIRYIEKTGDKLFFKSGGGITYMSDPVKEYEELISKVYVPVG